MPTVKVPALHRESIRRIARLDDEGFKVLQGALDTAATPVLARSDLTKAVSTALDLDDRRALLMVDALLGAQGVLQRRGASPAEIGLAIASDGALKLSDDESAALSSRLERLLSADQLALLAHAAGLLAEDDRTFCRARTLSDMRPVFSESDPPEMNAVLIHHSLKIAVHVDHGMESFYVTIDNRGLVNLREAIDRAIAKGQALSAVAESAGLLVVDMEGNH
jgi:hypothetical protein